MTWPLAAIGPDGSGWADRCPDRSVQAHWPALSLARMSLIRRLRVTGSRISGHRIHRRPGEDAGQSIPLLAGERVKLWRRRQTSGEPASLDSVVLLGVIVRLVLAFVLAIPLGAAVASVAVIVFATRPAAPWSGRSARALFRLVAHPPSADETISISDIGVGIFVLKVGAQNTILGHLEILRQEAIKIVVQATNWSEFRPALQSETRDEASDSLSENIMRDCIVFAA